MFKGTSAKLIGWILLIAFGLWFLADVTQTHFTFLHRPIIQASQILQLFLPLMAVALILLFSFFGILSALWEPFKKKEEPAKGGGGGGRNRSGKNGKGKDKH